MSNYNLKAKNKKTGEIVEMRKEKGFTRFDGYGYAVLNDTVCVDVLSEDEFNELYEVVEDCELGDESDKYWENRRKETMPVIDVNLGNFEDPNHPYGGMTNNWIEEFNNEFVMFNGQYVEPTFRDKSDVQPVINFITTLLEKQREEYVDMVRDYQKKDSDFMLHIVCNDIIKLLKSHE